MKRYNFNYALFAIMLVCLTITGLFFYGIFMMFIKLGLVKGLMILAGIILAAMFAIWLMTKDAPNMDDLDAIIWDDKKSS